MSGMTLKIEEVSPTQAEQWLTLSKGNRRLNDDYVLALALAMDRGTGVPGGWFPEASEIVFDEEGRLIDGHHRLSAVTTLTKNVMMAVKRNVPLEARNVIDTGRTRNMADLLTMYRSDVDYPKMRRATLSSCVDLLMVVGHGTRKTPPLRTLHDYDKWNKWFQEGIDWIIPATKNSSIAKSISSSFSASAITGPFAFAHKTNPDAVAKFHERCIRGEGLRANEPAFTLRNFVLASGTAQDYRRGIRAAGGRREASLKVLSAIHAALEGKTITKLFTNAYALPNFHAAYENRAVAKLLKPWAVPAPDVAEGGQP
jgi:hypothetical protein